MRKLSKRNLRAQRKGWRYGKGTDPSAKHALQYFPLWERVLEGEWPQPDATLLTIKEHA